MTSSDFDDILREVRAGEVAARPCAGVAVGDEPRHPRPAGTRLTMMALYAVDYQGREPDGGMADMDLRPMLDLIAAQYAGCDACQVKQTATVADNPALLTHLIGVALCSLTSISDQVSARLLLQKLDPPGAAIAITMRSVGLLAAVDVAASLSADDRRSAVAIAAGCLLPTGWFNQPLSNFYEDGTRAGSGDAAMLSDLRHDGYLPS